jgi:hypothetical protein
MASLSGEGFYGFYYLILISSLYFLLKFFVSNTKVIFIWTIIYYLLLIAGQFLINLNTTISICGTYQYVTALIVTLIPWISMFGVLNLILNVFPGWLSPFSNTIGYLVAKLSGIGSLFNKLLVSRQENETNKLIESIYNDQSLLINEITTGNFDIFWNNMINGGIFNSSVTEEQKLKLYSLVKLKELVSEFIWYILIGALITTTTYNYIINSDCNKTVDELKELQNDLLDTNNSESVFAAANDNMSRMYQSF